MTQSPLSIYLAGQNPARTQPTSRSSPYRRSVDLLVIVMLVAFCGGAEAITQGIAWLICRLLGWQ